MANLAAGDYIIVSAVNTGLVLDASGAGQASGTNVALWALNYSDAQVWRVGYRKDGTMRLSSRWCGKCVDVAGGAIKDGTNVQLWTDNDGRAQRWTPTDTGATATVDGGTYALWQLVLADATGYALDVSAASGKPGANVQIWSKNTTGAQRWAFVPVPMFRPGGIYEVAASYRTDLRFDIENASRANGANLRLWPANHSNAQRFRLVADGHGRYGIQNVSSGKYMHAANGGNAPTAGENVHQWAGMSTDGTTGRQSVWTVQLTGDVVTADGVQCAVVNFLSGLDEDYRMDATAGQTASGTNIQLWTENTSNAQRFALVPTTKGDPNVPAPYGIGWATRVGADGSLDKPNGTLFPCWSMSPEFAAPLGNHFQHRMRRRAMSPATGQWGEWGEWGEWADSSATVKGSTAWLTEGVDASFGLADAKQLEVQLEVRAMSTDGKSAIHGGSTSDVLTARWVPAAALTAGWSPEGLRIGVASSDGWPGTLGIDVLDVRAGGTVVFDAGSEPLREDGLAASGDSTIVPASRLLAAPRAGDELTVTYRLRTDADKAWTEARTATVALASTGGTADLGAKVAEGPGRAAVVTLADLGATTVWWSDGTRTREAIGGGGEWSVPYPFGGGVTIMAASTSADGTRWGTWSVAYGPTKAPCHAWNWDGGSALLELREGSALETGYTLEAVYDAAALCGREREAVTYQGTTKGSFDAEGVLVPGVSESTAADFEALLAQGHATYRSPSGRVTDVAVTGVSFEEHRRHTTVKVSMIEETV